MDYITDAVFNLFELAILDNVCVHLINCKITFKRKIFNKRPLKILNSWVWFMFLKYWENPDLK